MLYLNGRLPTAEASRYMVRLCYHFTKKIEVNYDDTQGLAKFPWGICRLTALDDAIRFECEADDPEKMAQVQRVIDSHVALFSRKAPLSVVWAIDAVS
ncbi:DUF2218 domain-containing protein [Rhodoferax ferrireducens]|uniref:DUF2218 domain-containing protein n=1 Tax=Rhodoferax ferrireducens TaxID=192843 RepID=UPI000E0DACBD|nr:DUF2218 domain-containing protein [Rhodoferax ferrireducens]